MAPRTREELESSNKTDPELKKEIEANPVPAESLALEHFGLIGHRARFLAERRRFQPIPAAVPEVAETLLRVEMRDGYEITIKLYSPNNPPKEGSPLVVMYHEGGWQMGDLTDEDQNCRMFARDLGCVCLNVDYRLAPKFPFPTGVNDCWDALQWAAKNAEGLQAKPELGFIIGGASAGGNLSAILAHLARDNGLSPPLTGQYLVVPFVCWADHIPDRYKDEFISIDENKDDPVLKNVKWSPLLEVYNPDTESPLFSPLLWKDEEGRVAMGHKNLPKAYLQVCGMDPLRDDGLVYERMLREDFGIPTKLDLYPGFGHMFWTNFPKMKRSWEFVDDTLQGFKWLLEKA